MDAIKFECYKNNACLSKHCVEPKELECGSYICSVCADELTRFKCKHCAAEHGRAFFHILCQSEVDKLFGYCLKQYENVFHRIEELESTMDYNRDNVFDEIDIKVESLKMDLDNLRDKLKNEFVQKRNEVKSEFSKQRIHISRQIDEVKAIINEQVELLRTEKSFKIHSNSIKEAYASIENSQKKISFEINESTIDQSVIGSNLSALESFFKQYADDRIRIIDRLKDMIPLPNNKTLLVYKSKMAVYSNWSTLPSFEKQIPLDDKVYKVYSNNQDAIYCTQRRDSTGSCSVVQLDLDLNVVKQFVFPFETVPLAIECDKEFIYCSVQNQIFKLSRDFEVVETTMIRSGWIMSFKISSMSIACLVFVGGSYGFFDVNKNFSLLSTHHSAETEIDSVVLLSDHFYLYNYHDNKSIIYSNKGDYQFEFQICPDTDEYCIAQSSLKFNGGLFRPLNDCLNGHDDYDDRNEPMGDDDDVDDDIFADYDDDDDNVNNEDMDDEDDYDDDCDDDDDGGFIGYV